MALMNRDQKSKKLSMMKLGTILPILAGVLGGGAGLVVGGMAVFAPKKLASVFGVGYQHSRASSRFPSTQPKVSGTFTATGQKLGSWTFKPNSCRSGRPHGFHGVFLTRDGDRQHRVRVVRNVDGTAMVVVAKPGTDKAMVYRDCEMLAASVRRTNTRVNEIWSMKGSVQVRCPGFSGSATFDGCH